MALATPNKPLFESMLLWTVLSLTFIAGLLNSLADPFVPTVRLYLSDLSESEPVEIFLDTGNGFNPTQRIAQKVFPSEKTSIARFRIPELTETNVIRVDISNRPTELNIERIRLTTLHGDFELKGAALLEEAIAPFQVTLNPSPGDLVRFNALGIDPQFQINVPASIKSGIRTEVLIGGIVALVLGILFAALTIKAGRWLSLRINNSHLSFHRIGFAITATCALVMLVGKLHFSSIEMWNFYLPEPDGESSLVLGSPLPIRSDEWVTQSPWVISQWSEQQPMTKPGSPEGLLWLVSAPTMDFMMIAQPKFWGSIIFDEERSFSWAWIYKSLGLLCAMYFLFVVLSHNRFYSLIGAFLVYGASATQWWFSSNLPEIIIGFAVATGSFLSLMSARRRSDILFYSVLLWLFCITILMHPYPPFLIPLFYLGLLISIGHIAGMDKSILLDQLRLKTIGVLCSVIGVTGFALLLYFNGQPAIELVNNTLYPGSRISTGGEVSTSRYFAALYEFWRTSPNSFPIELGNASEASGYILYWLILAPIVLAIFKTKPFFEISLLCFAGILTAYMMVGVPSQVAIFTAMSFVPGPRSVIALGIASVLVLVLLGSRLEAMKGPIHTSTTLVICFIPFVTTLTIGVYLQSLDAFYSYPRILASAFLFSILCLALVRRSRPLVAACTLSLVAPSMSINPLSSGLDPILNKEVFKVAKEIAPDSSVWLVHGNGLYAQAFVANGFQVKFGQQYVPELSLYSSLDPDSENAEVWNRYARINFFDSAAQEPLFHLIQADNFSISVDLCSPRMKALGITHIASQSDLSMKPCLDKKTPQPVTGFYLYEYQAP